MLEWRIEQFDDLPSTMDALHERARQGAAEGLVIITKTQTQGRGRGKNIWLDQGGNLSCSLLLRPNINRIQAGQYSFIIACALNSSFQNFVKSPHSVTNKWPNDVLLNDIKSAGILLEADIDDKSDINYLNIGVGVNIASAPEGKIALNEISIAPVTAPEFLDIFLKNLNLHIDNFKQNGFRAIKGEWLKNASHVNEMITARLPQETISGIFKGLHDDGALEIELPSNKIRLIHSGDVYFPETN